MRYHANSPNSTTDAKVRLNHDVATSDAVEAWSVSADEAWAATDMCCAFPFADAVQIQSTAQALRCRPSTIVPH